MSEHIATMLNMAQKAVKIAYAPYSKFLVGACIRTTENQFFSGCNIESCSYPLALCAEATTIAQMVAAGQQAIAEVLVVADSPQACAPCGACRQRIIEFATDDVLVHMANQSGALITQTIGDLLPMAFRSSHLT